MPISPEFLSGLPTGYRAKCLKLIEEERALCRKLWANHREQDVVMAELALLRGQQVMELREAMTGAG